jgi:hypothetical protein
MPKRELADRILDEVLTLRRPRSVMEELGEQSHRQAEQDRVIEEEIVAASSRRQFIVE